MSTAELETPPVVPEAPYVMPKANDQLLVNWYPSANGLEKPYLAAVLERFDNCLRMNVITEGGMVYKRTVPHMSDPRFKNNPNWGHDGCWDFTDQSKQFKTAILQTEFIADQLRAEIADLQQQSTFIADRVSKAAFSQGSDMRTEFDAMKSEIHSLKVKIGQLKGKHGE